MTSEYGHKFKPHRKIRTPRGIKSMRKTIFNTHVPANIDQGEILTVRVPDIGPHDVIVPGTAKWSFKKTLNSTADANRTICNNLGRAIVSKIEVKLEGKSFFTLDDSDIFLSYQGICSEAIRKIRIDADDKDLSNANNNAVGSTYSNRFSIPLDFELLTSHMPFFQHDLKDRLSHELTFNSYGTVIVSEDNEATYSISDIHFEYQKITSQELAMALNAQNQGKLTIFYDRV